MIFFAETLKINMTSYKTSNFGIDFSLDQLKFVNKSWILKMCFFFIDSFNFIFFLI